MTAHTGVNQPAALAIPSAVDRLRRSAQRCADTQLRLPVASPCQVMDITQVFPQVNTVEVALMRTHGNGRLSDTDAGD